MKSLLAFDRLSPRYTESLLYISPALAASAGLFLGNVTSSAFALLALALWVSVSYLLQDLTQDGTAWPRVAKFAPWLVLAFGIAVLLLTTHNPAAPKLAYSAITLAVIAGLAACAAYRWTDPSMTLKALLAEICAFVALCLWLIYGESDWYIIPVTPTGVPHTKPYLAALPLWWWGACVVLPAAALLLRSSRQGLAQRISILRQPAFVDPTVRNSLVAAGLLIIFLMAALQIIDFIQPRLGRAIFEGDDFTYLTNVYQLLERGEFTPFHMPLISIYLSLIFAIAGENANAILFTNGAVVLLTVALGLYALWLISTDIRLLLLGGLMFVSLRSIYMFVWTSLTETLNDMLWVAAFVGLLTALRRPTFPGHLWFGFVIGLLLLARSQNLGGIIGVGLAYAVLVLAIRTKPLRSIALVMVMLAAAAIPLVAWGKYQEATNGRFQIMDGRGAGVFLGMNMPNVNNGLDSGAWTANLEAWEAKHPNASSSDMLMAGLRYRIERPAETVHYYSQRTLEMLNFRFSSLMGWSAFSGFKPNLQLVLALSACFLLFFTPSRWVAVMIWAIFVPFIGIFVAIYAEARYRIPMDSLLTVGAAIAMAQAAFKVRVVQAETEGRFLFGQPPARIFMTVLAMTVILVGVMRAVAVAPLSGRPSSFVTGKLVPNGAVLENGPPPDMASYANLATWEELVKKNHPATLQGSLFRGRFRLIGSLFRVGNKNEYRGLHLPEDEYYRADLPAEIEGQLVKIDRLAISFNGAAIESGMKQRGIIDIVGRVRILPEYYQRNYERTRFVLIDALYARCADPKAPLQPDSSDTSKKPSLC